MAIFKIVPTDYQAKKSVIKILWGWVVVGAIVLFLLGGGLTFMTSGHPLIADCFYVAGAALFISKFLTWEEAKQEDARRRRWVVGLSIVITGLVLIGAIAGNHYLNRSSTPRATLVSPPLKEGDDNTASMPNVAPKSGQPAPSLGWDEKTKKPSVPMSHSRAKASPLPEERQDTVHIDDKVDRKKTLASIDTKVTRAPENQTPSNVISAPNGIAIGGGNVTNPTVNNFGPQQRHVSPSDMSSLSQCLSQKPGTLDIGAIAGDKDSSIYVKDWRDIFVAAKWSIKDNVIHAFMVGAGDVPLGTLISIRGSFDVATKTANYSHNSPEGIFVGCTVGSGFRVATDNVQITPHLDVPEGTVVIMVYPAPSS